MSSQNLTVRGKANEETRIARWVWSLLRGTVEKLAMPGEDQINDPAIEEGFDWDPSYLMVDRCQDLGWITAELRGLLDALDGLLDRLSDDPRFWSDACIVSDPLWRHIRRVSQEAAALMPERPWDKP